MQHQHANQLDQQQGLNVSAQSSTTTLGDTVHPSRPFGVSPLHIITRYHEPSDRQNNISNEKVNDPLASTLNTKPEGLDAIATPTQSQADLALQQANDDRHLSE